MRLINSYQAPPLLRIPQGSVIHLLRIPDIVRLETESSVARRQGRTVRNGDGNFVHFYTATGQSLLVCKKLSDWERVLKPFGFFRSHQSHLVNLAHVDRIETRDGLELVILLENGKSARVPVSYKKKEALANHPLLISWDSHQP